METRRPHLFAGTLVPAYRFYNPSSFFAFDGEDIAFFYLSSTMFLGKPSYQGGYEFSRESG